MPKDDERKEMTQEELDAREEKFRTFFTTSVAQVPEEMTRRDDENEEKPKSLLGRLLRREKGEQQESGTLNHQPSPQTTCERKRGKHQDDKERSDDSSAPFVQVTARACVPSALCRLSGFDRIHRAIDFLFQKQDVDDGDVFLRHK